MASGPTSSPGPTATTGTIPDVCFSACNAAYKIAMSVGKTDELCDEQSEFRVAYQGCAACLGEGAPFEEFDPEFRQILDFCGIGLGLTTEAFYLGGGSSTTLTYVNQAPTAPTSKTTSLTTDGSTAPSSAPSARPTSSPIEGESNGNQAWIAGPVVGSIVGVALIASGIWYFTSRRRRPVSSPDDFDPTSDKPQLHSDCIPKEPPVELDLEEIHEMEAPLPTAPPSEKPANEAAAQEMPG